MAMKIWLDDRLVDADDAKISVFDHGLLYGDGVFEGIRVYDGRIFEFDAHLKRLYLSAKVLRLTMPIPEDALADAVPALELLQLGGQHVPEYIGLGAVHHELHALFQELVFHLVEMVLQGEQTFIREHIYAEQSHVEFEFFGLSF